MNTKQIHKQKKEKSMISYYKNEDIKVEHYQGKYNKQKHFDNINNEFNVEEVSPFSFNGDSKRENKITNNHQPNVINTQTKHRDKLSLAINSIII